MTKRKTKKKGTTRTDAAGLILIAAGIIMAAALIFGEEAVVVKYLKMCMLGAMGMLGWLFPPVYGLCHPREISRAEARRL